MNRADANKMSLSGEIQRASEKKTKEEMNLHKIDTDIEAMQERVWEEYNMTYASAVEHKQEDFNIDQEEIDLQESLNVVKKFILEIENESE